MATGRQLALLAVAIALACERAPPRLAPTDTIAVATPDTVVRRIPLVWRRASAMQRVTPIVQVHRALEPLDSAFVVRVFDQRGIEMSGVLVQWSLFNAGDGAQLRVINARTDALGLSRVAFTPGRSASPQGAIAEGPDVGRIEFAVNVPVKSIRISTESEVWSGEEAIAGATLKDDAANRRVAVS